MKRRCMVCGCDVSDSIRTITLPHGRINLCHDIKCSRFLNFKVNDAIPVVWFDSQELIEKELINPEVLDHYKHNPDTMIDCGRVMEEALWNDDMMGEMFNEAVEIVASELEKKFVKDTDAKNLIPYIGMLKNDQANIELEKKLKGGYTVPDWCSNILMVQGEQAQKFYDDNKGTDSELSFEALVPVDESCYQQQALHKWGTKWDAHDVEVISGDVDHVKYAFSTAWNPPTAWLQEVSHKYPDLSFDMISEEGGNDVYQVVTASGGTVDIEELSAYDYYKRFHEDFSIEARQVEELPYDQLIETYTDPEVTFDEWPFTMLDEKLLARLQNKDLPLFINKDWGSQQEEYLKRMTGIGAANV